MDVEQQRLVGPRNRDWPTSGSPNGDRVADLELLKAGDQRVGAGVTENAEELVELVIAVQAAASIAHLRKPGPDMMRTRIDGDGASGNLLRILDEAIARHVSDDFCWRGPPVDVPRPDDDQVEGHEDNQRRRCCQAAACPTVR